MKIKTMTKNLLISGAVVSLLFLYTGSVKGESPPGKPGDLNSLANKDSKKFGNEQYGGRDKDKSERFKELEFLIMQSLLKQYERLDGDTEIVDAE